MFKPEIQHQYWITKKAVQRKLGSKEDDCIVSSDAELDTKLEIFKSIAASITNLSKIVDCFHERLYNLSQEECAFGRFLHDSGKRSKTTSQCITNSGKAITFCGQQRMCVRVPLFRLQHEVKIFDEFAISDTQNTINAMEKERTEYRATLEWMKSLSDELDPDSAKELDKFRAAQSHVRTSKHNFDRISMDAMQKIDLLAAARCNMFSHVLTNYMNELRQFTERTINGINTITATMQGTPKYDFCILKQLLKNENVKTNEQFNLVEDRLLFIADEEHPVTSNNGDKPNSLLNDIPDNLIDVPINMSEEPSSIEQLVPAKTSQQTEDLYQNQTNEIANKSNDKQQQQQQQQNKKATCTETNNENIPWLKLFEDLDPLIDLDSFDSKLNENNKNIMQT